MRLHADGSERESRLCLAAVVAIMLLTGSAILISGLHYYSPKTAMTRVVLSAPF
ncbi:MAG: hypothetical protein HY242_09510 [Afipia sp.]|nr:hypothetical protein [Afipia sp.]